MSTKIHFGYKIPAYTVTELMDFLQGFREHAKARIETAQYRYITKNAAMQHDLDVLYGNEIRDNYMFKAWSYFRDGIIEASKQPHRRSPEFDYGLDLVIFPRNKDSHLVLVFSEKCENLFREYPDVEHYPYWDNTDPPEGMSWKAWKKRGKEWLEAWKPATPANEAGLSFVVWDSKDYLIPELSKYEIWEQHIPSLEDRIKAASFEHRIKVIDDWGRVFFEENPEEKDKLFSNIRRFEDSEEFKKAMSEFESKAGETLQPLSCEILYKRK